MPYAPNMEDDGVVVDVELQNGTVLGIKKIEGKWYVIGVFQMNVPDPKPTLKQWQERELTVKMINQ